MLFPRLLSGYSKFEPSTDIPDLHGKVILITGANSGIGYAAAEELVKKGAKVYVGARSESRGREAVARITAASARIPSVGSAHWLPMDLSTPRSTKAGADAFLALEGRLDVLINNAGIMGDKYQTVSEGGVSISNMMSTNHLGPFVLTKLLTPVLKKTADEPGSDVRVVVIASSLHRRLSEKPNFRNLEGWNTTGDSMSQTGKRYSISKLANVLFARELQSRFDSSKTPITCISVQPGIVRTEGSISNTDALGLVGWVIGWIIRLVGMTPVEGAYTSLFAATSPQVSAHPELYKGGYLKPFDRLSSSSDWSYDKDGLGMNLWNCSEE